MISNALIIGGGIAGLTAAIALRKRSIDVDVVELHPRVTGAGVGLSANALRPLQEIAVLEDVLAISTPNETGHICDAAGGTLSDTPRDVPREWGMPSNVVVGRPDLSEVLGGHALRLGAHIRYHVTVAEMVQKGDHVDIRFTDGGTGRYDLVIGADGLGSATRGMAFGDIVQPNYAGQCGWRWFTPTHEGVPGGRLLLSGIPGLKFGVYPLPGGKMYAFTTAHLPDLDLAPQADQREVVREQLAHFSAPYMADIIADLPDASEIFYSPFSTLLVPRPWHRGRVLLIGDAAHTVTPHSSSGAALAIEDAVVLAQMLGEGGDIEQLLEAFSARRFDRVEKVINFSRDACLSENAGEAPPAGEVARAFWSFLLEPI